MQGNNKTMDTFRWNPATLVYDPVLVGIPCRYEEWNKNPTTGYKVKEDHLHDLTFCEIHDIIECDKLVYSDGREAIVTLIITEDDFLGKHMEINSRQLVSRLHQVVELKRLQPMSTQADYDEDFQEWKNEDQKVYDTFSHTVLVDPAKAMSSRMKYNSEGGYMDLSELVVTFDALGINEMPDVLLNDVLIINGDEYNIDCTVPEISRLYVCVTRRKTNESTPQ